MAGEWRADVPVQAHGLRVLDRAVSRRQDKAVHDLGRRLAVALRTADEFHRCRDTSTSSTSSHGHASSLATGTDAFIIAGLLPSIVDALDTSWRPGRW